MQRVIRFFNHGMAHNPEVWNARHAGFIVIIKRSRRITPTDIRSGIQVVRRKGYSIVMCSATARLLLSVTDAAWLFSSGKDRLCEKFYRREVPDVCTFQNCGPLNLMPRTIDGENCRLASFLSESRIADAIGDFSERLKVHKVSVDRPAQGAAL